MIRAVRKDDLCRLAEIIVFNNRINYYPIFQDIEYSFGEYNVLSVMEMFEKDKIFTSSTSVYEDPVIKGFITVHDGEIRKLYVDSFFRINRLVRLCWMPFLTHFMYGHCRKTHVPFPFIKETDLFRMAKQS